MRNKFFYIHCPYCNFPQFVNKEITITRCLACGKEFEIIDGKEKEYYDKGKSIKY
jgi:DNA-directed RNA polymerase subunit RPC12/RpoP